MSTERHAPEDEEGDPDGEEASRRRAPDGETRDEDGGAREAGEFDERVVDLLSWILDTETRARIYVHLRKHPNSTSEEVATGTGLYPSTVREALADLHAEGTVERRKRRNAGAGNNPYEYDAIPPSELVAGVVGEIQAELNAVFNLDRYLSGGAADAEPVTITVEEVGDD